MNIFDAEARRIAAIVGYVTIAAVIGVLMGPLWPAILPVYVWFTLDRLAWAFRDEGLESRLMLRSLKRDLALT